MIAAVFSRDSLVPGLRVGTRSLRAVWRNKELADKLQRMEFQAVMLKDSLARQGELYLTVALCAQFTRRPAGGEDRSENLLLNIPPAEVAEEFKKNIFEVKLTCRPTPGS